MAIYGTALLSLCLLLGSILGHLMGRAIGVDKDVGGVGIAMLMPQFIKSLLLGFELVPGSIQFLPFPQLADFLAQGLLFGLNFYIELL